MIRLNLDNFYKLQGELSETEISNKLGISRSQLWRVKTSNSAVGESFIAKFKAAYPDEPMDNYFFVETVPSKERSGAL